MGSQWGKKITLYQLGLVHCPIIIRCLRKSLYKPKSTSTITCRCLPIDPHTARMFSFHVLHVSLFSTSGMLFTWDSISQHLHLSLVSFYWQYKAGLEKEFNRRTFQNYSDPYDFTKANTNLSHHIFQQKVNTDTQMFQVVSVNSFTFKSPTKLIDE